MKTQIAATIAIAFATVFASAAYANHGGKHHGEMFEKCRTEAGLTDKKQKPTAEQKATIKACVEKAKADKTEAK